MDKTTFLLSGSGGQGVITMGILLAEAAALYEGVTAIQSQSYGPEARGGATRCDVVVSQTPIYFPKVLQPGVLVSLTDEALARYLQYLRPGGLLLVDTHTVQTSPKADARVISLPLYETVMNAIGKAQVFNICVLGALAALTGVVQLTSLQKTLESRFASAHNAANFKALELGYGLAQGFAE